MKQTIEIDVPDGYDVDYIADPQINSGANKRMLSIILKPKQTKDFNWYIDQYLAESRITSDNLAGWINDRDLETAKNRLKTKQFNLVCWEIKMGLFRFICKEYKMDWNDIVGFFVYYNSNTISNYSEHYLGCRVLSICPKEFIDDLFK